MTRRGLIVLLAVLCGGILAGAFAQRWLNRRPDRTARSEAPSVPEIVRAARAGRPVIFVGLDGADWELLDQYVAAGRMPHLAALLGEGSAGVLSTIHPPLSPLVWTTMMTGTSPIEHGILDFTRFRPGSGEKEPITSDERRVPAVWNMATQAGRRVGVFGLWATFPAEPVNGVMVSDRLFTFLFKEDVPPAGVVHPPSREAWARQALQRAEDAVGYEALKAYLPWLDASEYRQRVAVPDPYAQPVSALRRILVETRVYHDLAMDWLAAEKPDLTIVYLQGTDTIGHVFAPYAPPRQTEIPPVDYEHYHQVPERYFEYVDGLLGDYRRQAEARGAVLVLASDHGFRWREGRPVTLSSVAHATAARWHRDEGIYLIWGPGIAGSRGHTARGSVTQVCATLGTLLGLPKAKNTDMTPLPGTPASTDDRLADYRAQYRPVTAATDAGRPHDDKVDAEAIEKLKALGYVGANEPAVAPAASQGGTRTPGSYNNEGLILKNQGRREEARAAFERAIALDPHLASALWNLSDLLFTEAAQADKSDELLVRAFAEGVPEGERLLVGRAISYQRSGQVERSLKLVSGAARARPDEPELLLFRGRYRVEKGDCAGAADDFERAAGLSPRNPAAYASLGVARLCLGDRKSARRAFEHSLQLDPDQARVREYLGRL